MTSAQETATIASIIFVQLMILVFFGLTLKVMYDIKKSKCKCSDDSRYNYIMFYMYYSLAFVVLGMIGFKLHAHIPRIFAVILSIYAITMCFITALFLHNLSKPECDCEKSTFQKVVRYLWYANSGVQILTIIFIVYMLFKVGKVMTAK